MIVFPVQHPGKIPIGLMIIPQLNMTSGQIEEGRNGRIFPNYFGLEIRDRLLI
jgi:hypothetical protein